MIKEAVTIEEAIEVLNEAVALDAGAMQALIAARVECNRELGDHETIQVGNYHKTGVLKVGLLGILNGFFGVDDRDLSGAIAAIYNVDCPRGCKMGDESGEVNLGRQLGDLCPECEAPLILGNLIGFKKIR